MQTSDQLCVVCVENNAITDERISYAHNEDKHTHYQVTLFT